MEEYIGLPATPHLSNYCELASTPGSFPSQDDSTLCFLKSMSSISSTNDLSVESQPLRQNVPQIPRFSGGFPQQSISNVDQNSLRETCLFTNQNFRSRTVSAQATSPFSMESWNDSLEFVNPEKSVSGNTIVEAHTAVDFGHTTLNSEQNHTYKGQHSKIPVWVKQTLSSYAGSSQSLDQMASTEGGDGPAVVPITKNGSGLGNSSRVECWALEVQKRHNLHQLKKLFLNWRRAALSHSKASDFFYTRLMARVFKSMRNFTQKAIRRRESLALAVQHDRRRVCRLAFQTWARKARLQQAVYRKFHIALLHYRNELTRTAFLRWRTYSNRMTKRRLARENLAKINNVQLLRRIWRAWSRFTSHQRALRQGCAHLKVILEKSLKVEAFEHWRRRSWQLPRARLLAFNVEQSQNAALLHQVFSDWRQMTEETRAQRLERQMILDDASRRTATKSKALYFRCWQDALDVQMKHEVAAKASERRILLKTFDCWRGWTAELLHQDCLQKQAKCFLETRLKISFFTRWIDAQRELRRIRTLEKIALSHWALAMEARVWMAWRVFLKNKQKEQARRRAAYQRYLSRLAKQALTLWLTSGFNMQKGRLSQTKSCKTHQNLLAMKFYQIWIGALPLKRKCCNYSPGLQGSQLCPSEDSGCTENYEAGEEDYFLASLNIDLNYHKLQPRIPLCILASSKNRIISGKSSLTVENLGIENGEGVPTERKTRPESCQDPGSHDTLNLGETTLGRFTENLFSLSNFYEISSGLLQNLHHASAVKRRKRKLKCQLHALEAAKTKENDPILKMQITEEIDQVNADMRIVQENLLSLCQDCNTSLFKLSKMLF